MRFEISDLRPVLLATAAMGTRFELALVGDEESRLRAVGEEALREIELWHERLSRFLPHSDVARLNRDPAARVHPETRGLLDLCDALKEETGGAFDVGVGTAMESLGLHPAGTGLIDLGAIGKGFAIDRAAAILRESGVVSALLHGGTSSVIAIGEWPLAIGSDDEPLLVRLCDQAIGVSAAKSASPPMCPQRSTGGGGAAAEISSDADFTGHILDPRSSRLAKGADMAAVIGESAALCDAWSTALIVLGSPPPRFPSGYESHIHTSTHGWRSFQPDPQPA